MLRVVAAALVLAFAGPSAGFLVWSRADRWLLLVAVGWVIAGALPVEHLLLLSADMAGARVLYLPVLGVALFSGLLAGGVPETRQRMLLAAGLLIFQLTALLHNEALWRGTALLAQRTCQAVGTVLAAGEPVAFRDLPVTWHGVFFLANGFPYCVEMNSGVPASRVKVLSAGEKTERGTRLLEWSDARAAFVEADKPR